MEPFYEVGVRGYGRTSLSPSSSRSFCRTFRINNQPSDRAKNEWKEVLRSSISRSKGEIFFGCASSR